MAKGSKNTGLKSPALVAASTPAGQQAIATTTATAAKAADEGIKLAIFLVKIGLGAFAVWYLIGLWQKRFVKIGTNPNFDPANVSDAIAAAKADAIYDAMVGWGANVEMVASQLAGLNYNGWVKVYNAFGNRKGANPFGDAKNLVEWLHDQFSDPDKISQLQNVLPGVF